MRPLRVVATALFVAMSTFAVWIVVAIRFLHLAGGAPGIGTSPATPSLFSTTDIISVWLALLGVLIALASLVMTGVGLALGALAIFGYQTFENLVDKRVGEATEAKVTEFFQGPAFESTVEGKIKQHLSAKPSQSATASATTAEPLAVKRYPRRKGKPDA